MKKKRKRRKNKRKTLEEKKASENEIDSALEERFQIRKAL